jgi:hypothetical protein
MDEYYSDEVRENTLFHYTSAEGLRGILQDRALRATAYYSTNDSSEIKYSIKVVENVILNELREKYPCASCSKLLDAMRLEQINKLAIEMTREYIRVIQDITNDLSIEAYITCFTRKIDALPYMDGLLSQWRGYCKDGGYAIGFDLEKMREILESPITKSLILMGPVNYERTGEDIKKICERYIKPWTNELGDLNKVDTDKLEFPLKYFFPEKANSIEREEYHRIAKRAMLNDFYKVLLFQKNPHFKEENEFRICVLKGEGGEVDHFNRGDFIIPFVIDKNADITSCINRIIVGPCERSEDRAKGVSSLLHYNNIKRDDLEIRISEIPYDGG